MKHFLSILLLPVFVGAVRAVEFPGPIIEKTKAEELAIGNNVLSVQFVGNLRLGSVTDKLTGRTVTLGGADLFQLVLGDGSVVRSSQLKLAGQWAVQPLAGDPKFARLADRLPGRMLLATFEDEAGNLRVEWRAEMRDGANYVRQVVEFATLKTPIDVKEIVMLDMNLPEARVAGYTDGAPVVTENLFLGIEHPLAKNVVEKNDRKIGSWLPADMKRKQLKLDVGEITEAGNLEIRFDYERGAHRLDVMEVKLLAGDDVVATDAHHGFTGIAKQNNTYRLELKSAKPGTRYSIVAKIDSDAGTDSFGSVYAALPGSTTHVRCSLPRNFALTPGQPWTVSSAIGVYPAGQLRRAFLYYLERERAHPYRQYWHYNSWFDLNIGRNDNPDPLKRMTEAQCLDVIRAFGSELHDKRGVGLNGFVWDDGWDDWNSLWGFHAGFPNAFAKLKDEAAKQGAGMGAWLSPWGGYGGSHNQRVKFGREHGYETNAGGFSLGGPKYYAAFRDRCLQMIRDYNQNYFKFDGIGGGMYATGAPVSVAPDLDGLVRLLGELRRANPEVFVNCTVGTWASPYWTWFADSIWRQGADCDYSGAGNARERWITYRDERLYARFAKTSPLYPLNSMMYHGLIVSPHTQMPNPAQNIEAYRHEVQMAVAGGSGLGELYVTPSLMTAEAWDILAEALKWVRANADVLVDTHWVGGNPGKAEVYGYASWTPRIGTLVLRNPSDKPATFAVDVTKVFELPGNAAQSYRLTIPWKANAGNTALTLQAGKPQEINLAPFEVLVWDASPQ